MKVLIRFFGLTLAVSALAAQPSAQAGHGGLSAPVAVERPTEQAALPLRRVTLFSSGVGYFEHAGVVSGGAAVTLPFRLDALNDALKSLVVSDPGSSPLVRYPSEGTLYRSLGGLKTDLSAAQGLSDILRQLRGAEVAVHRRLWNFEDNRWEAKVEVLSGRIVGVEGGVLFNGAGSQRLSDRLTLLGADGAVSSLAVDDLESVSFADPEVSADFRRALDLLLENRNRTTRNITVELPGQGKREAGLGYVVSTPVWKASYRLDLGGGSEGKALLQGWAIVDNDGEEDWEDVELSLVTGRPVSFIQNLYPPYYQGRPTLPLAIAGVADAVVYGSGWAGSETLALEEEAVSSEPAAENGRTALKSAAPRALLSYSSADAALPEAPSPRPVGGSRGAGLETAFGAELGEQFEFTVRQLVTLGRQESAMLPLVEGEVPVTKTLVFSGERAAAGGSAHPAISAELVNETGMKLPAGPVTVFDGGSYAGDALLEFLSVGEKRLVSWGEDLTVSGSVTLESTRAVDAVTISAGVMTVTRKAASERRYTFRNASGEAKRLIIEHPITRGARLAEPAAFEEQTESVYRFERTLAASAVLTLDVREETPVLERVTLAGLNGISLAYYSSNQEIPKAVRDALARAGDLQKKILEAAAATAALEARRGELFEEQERIRKNLEAAGRDSGEGAVYLRRLSETDASIDAQNAAIAAAREAEEAARREYETYLANLSL